MADLVNSDLKDAIEKGDNIEKLKVEDHKGELLRNQQGRPFLLLSKLLYIDL